MVKNPVLQAIILHQTYEHIVPTRTLLQQIPTAIITMVSFYNLEKKMEYVCDDLNYTSHTTMDLNEYDIIQLGTKYEIKLSVDLNIVVESQVSTPVKIQWTRGEIDVATIVNRLNKEHVLGRSPLVFEYYSILEDEVMICNKGTHNAYVFLYAYDFVGMVPAGGVLTVDLNRLINFGSIEHFTTHHPYIVVGEVPILHLKATLQRKNDAGSYEKEERLILKPGIFSNSDELADHINSCITMKGERNGLIYHVSIDQGVLILHATHRQPNGSYVEVTSLYPFIGINGIKTVTFPLRTNGKVELDTYCGHLIDSNIQTRRMY